MKKYQSKLFILMLAILISVGAQATDVISDFDTGDTLTATKMTEIKDAVNSKQNRVTGVCPPGEAIGSINADGTVTCEVDNDTALGTGQILALPNTCIRGDSGNAMHFEMDSITPPGNTFGPGIRSSNTSSNSLHNYFCPIEIQIPPGATVTITGADIAFADLDTTCRIQAEIRSKPFGTSNGGTALSTVHSGTGATDFATTLTGARTKTFPTFSLAIQTNSIVWVNATIAFNATGGGDCRYHGALVDYSITNP